MNATCDHIAVTIAMCMSSDAVNIDSNPAAVNGLKGGERLAIRGFDEVRPDKSYQLVEDVKSQLIVDTITANDGGEDWTRFSASQKGVGADNPSFASNLNEHEISKSVTAMWTVRSAPRPRLDLDMQSTRSYANTPFLMVAHLGRTQHALM